MQSDAEEAEGLVVDGAGDVEAEAPKRKRQRRKSNEPASDADAAEAAKALPKEQTGAAEAAEAVPQEQPLDAPLAQQPEGPPQVDWPLAHTTIRLVVAEYEQANPAAETIMASAVRAEVGKRMGLTPEQMAAKTVE